jgi:hypothetical protein
MRGRGTVARVRAIGLDDAWCGHGIPCGPQ